MSRLAKEKSRDKLSRPDEPHNNNNKYHHRKKNNEDKAVTQKKGTKIFVDRNKQLDYGCARARNALFFRSYSFVI